jgi:hypothetical protein
LRIGSTQSSTPASYLWRLFDLAAPLVLRSRVRCDAVRAYLVSQGVSPDNITATGYGMSNPIADNATSAGRAQNRRVQMVVSGNAIGVQRSAPSAAPQSQALPQGTSNPPQ